MSAKPHLLDDDDLLNPANWLGVKELAGILGVNQQSIYNMLDAGANLPPVHRRVGSSKLRFFKPEVRRWMADPTCFTRTVSPSTRLAKPLEEARA